MSVVLRHGPFAVPRTPTGMVSGSVRLGPPLLLWPQPIDHPRRNGIVVTSYRPEPHEPDPGPYEDDLGQNGAGANWAALNYLTQEEVEELYAAIPQRYVLGMRQTSSWFEEPDMLPFGTDEMRVTYNSDMEDGPGL